MLRNIFFTKKQKQWVWFFSFFIGFIVILTGLYFRMMSVRSSAYEAEKQKIIKPVRTETTVSTEVWKTTSFLARVEGGQTIQVKADVGGWVVERRVIIGEKVKKDDILIILNDERKYLKLKESEALFKSADAKLKELKRKLKQTETLLEKGIVSRDSLDSMINQVNAQQAEVDALNATYKLRMWDVDHLTVRAPITGRIVEVLPDIGQEVEAEDLLVKMVNRSNERVVAGVDARWAKIIKPGMKVLFGTKFNGQLESTEGIILGVSPDMDSSSGTYKVEAQLIRNEYDWWPGEVVNMEVPLELLKEVIKIPRTAVLSDSREMFVFVYNDGIAIRTPVSVTWLNEKEGAIPTSMIPEGTEIIVEGHVGLAGGQPVRLVKDKG